jgi:hypothetical protein
VTRDERLADSERRFRRAGLPLLIEDFSASTNAFNRVAPLLALVFSARCSARSSSTGPSPLTSPPPSPAWRSPRRRGGR